MKVLPGLKALRYLIPFRDVGDTTNFLRAAADRHPGGFAAMGDDLEKFGVWPETHELCYTDGWLDRFFSELESNSDWLATSTPADAIASHAPLGPRRSARRFLYRNDGVVAAHAGPRALSRAARRVFVARGRDALSPRRHLARIFHQIRRIEPAAQENAARLAEDSPPFAQPPLRSRVQARPPGGRHAAAARPVQRSLLARRFRRPLFAAPAHRESGPRWSRPKPSRTRSRTTRSPSRTPPRSISMPTAATKFISPPTATPRSLTPDDGGTICGARFSSAQRHADQFARAPAGDLPRQAAKPFHAARARRAIHPRSDPRQGSSTSSAGCNTIAGREIRSACCCSRVRKTHEDYAKCSSTKMRRSPADDTASPVRLPPASRSLPRPAADWVALKTLSFSPTPAGFDISCDVALRRMAAGVGHSQHRD